MKIANDVSELIGNTPLVWLNKINQGNSDRFAAKLEYFNPFHSVKDRIGLAMINAAEKEGKINRETIILEPTNANAGSGTITGIGEVLKSRKPGFKVVAVEPKESAVLSGKAPSSHPIQGIGAGFIPKILNTKFIDEIIAVSGEQARMTAPTEGLLVGYSSGAAIWTAQQVANRVENNGKLIIMTIPSFGERTFSTNLYSQDGA